MLVVDATRDYQLGPDSTELQLLTNLKDPGLTFADRLP